MLEDGTMMMVRSLMKGGLNMWYLKVDLDVEEGTAEIVSLNSMSEKTKGKMEKLKKKLREIKPKRPPPPRPKPKPKPKPDGDKDKEDKQKQEAECAKMCAEEMDEDMSSNPGSTVTVMFEECHKQCMEGKHEGKDQQYCEEA